MGRLTKLAREARRMREMELPSYVKDCAKVQAELDQIFPRDPDPSFQPQKLSKEEKAELKKQLHENKTEDLPLFMEVVTLPPEVEKQPDASNNRIRETKNGNGKQVSPSVRKNRGSDLPVNERRPRAIPAGSKKPKSRTLHERSFPKTAKKSSSHGEGPEAA